MKKLSSCVLVLSLCLSQCGSICSAEEAVPKKEFVGERSDSEFESMGEAVSEKGVADVKANSETASHPEAVPQEAFVGEEANSEFESKEVKYSNIGEQMLDYIKEVLFNVWDFGIKN